MTSFRPLPLLSNPHVQTILGNLCSGVRAKLPTQPHIVSLSDGDRIVLHESLASRADKGLPMALLIHGLGGCHRSPYIERITQRLSDRGWRVFRMDLRGAGAGARLARRLYSAACSDDIRAVVAQLAQKFPTAPLAVAGFSLGGNIVLKFAGECAAAPMPGLCGVAAIAPPIDLVRCSELIAQYPFYDAFFLRHLMRQVKAHQLYFPEIPRVAFPRRLTLWQFDELYTAPRWGYAGALDYYRQASAMPRIGEIRVPTFILTARDDPFVAVESFEQLSASAAVEVHISAQGGHLGYLGRDQSGGVRWAETQVVNWLMKRIGRNP